MPAKDALKTAVIYGSARHHRQGIRAARFVVSQLQQRGHEVTLVDSMAYELPMLDKMFKEFSSFGLLLGYFLSPDF